MLYIRAAYFIVISFMVSYPIAAQGLTFTLSDDAIMALDCNCPYYNPFCYQDSNILAITDVNGPGVQFDIHFSDPANSSGETPGLYWVSSMYRGNGVLAGRDISMFDAFALKFTLLSFSGISLPSAARPVYVGSVISVGDTWGYHPEFIVINSQYYPSSKTLVTQTEGTGKINLIGLTCYIPYWYYNRIYPSPWDPNGAVVSILVEPAPGAVVMTSDPCQSLQLLSVDKCTVGAGSREGRDRISFSGKMNPAYRDFDGADNIRLVINSGDMQEPCVICVPINNNTYIKTGRYSYSGIDVNGIKKYLKLNLKTHKVYFSARNLNLSGLSCPLKTGINMAGFNADADVNEDIVNGRKKPIPINLLMRVKDSIRVDKITVKHSSRKDGDRLYVKGGFSVKDINVSMVDSDFVVELAGQEFIIPENSFKADKSGKRFKCNNIQLWNGSDLIGVASADFNFKNCTFTLTIKNTLVKANPYVTTDLVIKFAEFNAGVQVRLN